MSCCHSRSLGRRPGQTSIGSHGELRRPAIPLLVQSESGAAEPVELLVVTRGSMVSLATGCSRGTGRIPWLGEPFVGKETQAAPRMARPFAARSAKLRPLVAWLALTACAAASLAGCGGGDSGAESTNATKPTTPTVSSATAAGRAPAHARVVSSAGGAPTCGSRALRLSSEDLSPATGEHGGIFLLTNGSGSTCGLEGYPRVQLFVEGRPLPFRYKNGGGLYVTTRRPQVILLPPRAHAYFLVAKYRCDLGPASPSAQKIQVAPPGTSATPAIRSPSGLEYCRASSHERQRDDPGNTVVVSPVAASPRALIPR